LIFNKKKGKVSEFGKTFESPNKFDFLKIRNRTNAVGDHGEPNDVNAHLLTILFEKLASSQWNIENLWRFLK